MEPFDHPSPTWAKILLRIFVHPDFQEEIEGDLLEQYAYDRQRYGLQIARRRFYRQVFSVLRPALMFNINRHTMKFRHWIALFLAMAAIAAASIAPFLPGPENDLAHGVSQFAQVVGYLGMAFIPFGLIWLFIELRNKKDETLNRWSNGYYPALLTLTPIFVFVPLQAMRSLSMGQPFEWQPLAVITAVVALIIYQIQKLKQKTAYRFNPVPLYIVLLPFISLATSRFAVEQAAASSREKLILEAQPLLAAIGQYKTEHGEYPETLDALKGKYLAEIPKGRTMGVRPYQYERRNGAFQLSFEQLWHWSATEVTVYNPLGNPQLKGDYENYPTAHVNWRYYLVD